MRYPGTHCCRPSRRAGTHTIRAFTPVLDGLWQLWGRSPVCGWGGHGVSLPRPGGVRRGGYDDSVSHRRSPLIPPSPRRGEGVKRPASLTKFRRGQRACFLTISALLMTLLGAAPAAADPVADFYRGKSITMVIATSPGGDYDMRARLVARHMGRHIPGEPDHRAAQHAGRRSGCRPPTIWPTSAPRDGTVLHAIMQNMSALSGDGRRERRIRHPQVRSGSATRPTARTSSTPGTRPASRRSRT